MSGGWSCITIFFLILIPLAIWAISRGLRFLRLGYRWWLPLVVLYTLWIGGFWSFVSLRIYLPPEDSSSAISLAVVLVVLYLAYPLLQGVSANIIYMHEMGATLSWRSAVQKTAERYGALLSAFSTILVVYGLTVFGIYAIAGDGFANYFIGREAELSKLDVLWEALLSGYAFSVFVDMLPPIIFPVGVFVGLARPSSEFFFSMVIASFIAIGLLFLPMLRFIFWLPLLTLGRKESARGAFHQLLRVQSPPIVAEASEVVLRSFGLLLVLVVGVFFAPLPQGVLVSIGRWVAPLEFWGATGFLLGIFPGVISLMFQHERIRLYREVFDRPVEKSP